MHRRKMAGTEPDELAPSSVTPLLCLIAGVLLAGTLPGAIHYIFWRQALPCSRTQGHDCSGHDGKDNEKDNDGCRHNGYRLSKQHSPRNRRGWFSQLRL